jgi:uncharacterized membrane protein
VAAKISQTEATASSFSNGCFTGIKNKSIVHYWSTSKKLFITAPVGQFLCSAGQEVPEEKSRRGKIHQEIRQGRPLCHTEQRRRRLRHAHEDIVRASQRGAHFMMMMMMMMMMMIRI